MNLSSVLITMEETLIFSIENAMRLVSNFMPDCFIRYLTA